MQFSGDKKAGRSLLSRPEQKFRDWLVPKIPRRIETYHLTLTTLLWSLLIILFSFLARHDIRWLWAVSLMIFLQYVTDLLDGAVGRTRNTGLVKWGYYMDHLLDYVFMCSILIGYSMLLPDHFKYVLFFILALFGAFMINSFLSFAATNEFQITYMGVGPTEIRLVFIAVNTLLILCGKTYMVRVLPYVLGFSTFGLFITAYRTQRKLWRIDMRARYAEQQAGGTRASGSVSAPTPKVLSEDLPDPIGRLIANVGLSYLLAAIAFVLLMTKSFYPQHRKVAAALYAVSFVPFALSIRARRATLRRHGRRLRRRVKPYWPHVGVGVGLVLFAYCAHVVAPTEDSLLTKLSAGELRADLARDLESLGVLAKTTPELLNWAESEDMLARAVDELGPDQKEQLQDFWKEYVDLSLELDILQQRYKGFYLLDYNTAPDLHSTSFLIAYGAFLAQCRAAIRILEQIGDNVFLETFLNDGDPGRGIPPGTLAGVAQRVIHPDTLTRFTAGAAYFRLVKKDLEAHQAAVDCIEDDLTVVMKTLGKHPGILLETPLDYFERAAYTAWLPFQKEVAVRMSLVRTTDREYFITPEAIRRYRDHFQPGDILIERRNWHMTNIGIPGFWPHAALFIGTPEEINAAFSEIPLPDGRTPFDLIAEAYPDVAKLVGATDEGGHKRCVIEAIRDGVTLQSLEKSANCDYLGVIRTGLPPRVRFNAVMKGLGQYGKPYDYNFDFSTDQALVCSELIYKAYEDSPELGFTPVTMNGRLMLPPNRFVRLLDQTYGEQCLLEFVLFLDGNEAEQRFVEADLATFRKSWQRSKWDVMAE